MQGAAQAQEEGGGRVGGGGLGGGEGEGRLSGERKDRIQAIQRVVGLSTMLASASEWCEACGTFKPHWLHFLRSLCALT